MGHVPSFVDYKITVITEQRWNEILDDMRQQAPQEFFELIATLPEEELSSFHHTTGRFIRNTYELWANKWEPEDIDGVDHSPNHPDAISSSILKHLRLLQIAKNEDKLL